MTTARKGAAGAAVSKETIETLNVNPGVGGARVNRARYEAMRKALLKAVPEGKDGIAFRELPNAVKVHLPGGELPGGGSIGWYVTTVKLDLEARGILERLEGVSPQRVRRPRG